MPWKIIGHGGSIGEDKQYSAVSSIRDSRGVKHYAFVTGNSLYHMAMGSKSPFPLGNVERVTDIKVQGVPNIDFYPSAGILEITCPLKENRIGGWYRSMDEIPDPSGEEPEPPEPPPPPPPPPPENGLKVVGEDIYYNGKKTIFFGASLVEAFSRILDKHPDPPWQTLVYDEYVNYLATYNTNYVRQLVANDIPMIIAFCEDMKKQGKIVELILYAGKRTEQGLIRHMAIMSKPMPDPIAVINATIHFNHVIYDTHNEFLDEEDSIKMAKDLCTYIKSKRGISLAGAYGRSSHGQEYSERFDPIASDNSIISNHREWIRRHIERWTKKGKPVIQSECFDFGKNNPDYLNRDKFEMLSREFINWGASGYCFYPFIDSWKDMPDEGREKASYYLKYLEGLCLEFNS